MNKQTKLMIYKKARITCDCSQDEWAKIFNLGDNKGQQNVSKKEAGDRGINMPEALASSLLMFIDEIGYDINSISFNADLTVNISKK